MTTINSISYTLLLAALLTACGSKDRSNPIPSDDPIPVTLLALQNATDTLAIEASGVFTTDDETALGFKNGGVISRIYVKEGDPITKGQRLASVQPEEIDAKSGQTTAALAKAQRDYDRAKRLYRDSVATLEQLQNAQTALDVAKQDRNAVQYNLQHLHIVSPVSGYVLAKLANEGQVVGPGTPVLQVNGAHGSAWQLKVGVSDQQWAQIKVGDRATILTDALPDQLLPAHVAKKSEGLDPQSGTFALFLKVDGKPTGKLASGVFGKAKIQAHTGTSAHQWQVPFEALIDADGSKAYVYVTRDGKTASKQQIRIGKVEKDHVLVTGGLEGINAIIVSGSPYLLPGAAISIKK